MTWQKLRVVAAIAAVAAVVVGVLAFALVRAHSNAVSTVLTNFRERTALTATTTDNVMKGSLAQQTESLAKFFGGSQSSFADGLVQYRAWVGEAPDHAILLDANGHILFSEPATRGSFSALLARNPLIRKSLAGHATLSDVRIGRGGRPVAETAVPFRAADGSRRVFLDASPVDVLQSYVGGYLAAGPGVSGSHGYLVDGRGTVLAASTGATKMGRRLPDARLLEAIAHHPSGTVGGRYYASVSMTVSRWRIIFVAPKDRLLAPVNGSARRVTEILFGAFVLALALASLLALRTMRRSAQLAASREREQAAEKLAHERLHDSLTGLPNRALFQDRLAHALSGVVRRDASLAVLFVDLDRFKRINDSRGHGTGDELLCRVARRLAATLRPSDTISRFGGDEFLILCERIGDEQEAFRIARRVQHAIEAPLELDGQRVHLTACVGIALQGPTDRPISAGDLVLAADAAMYRAKDAGRAAIVLFDEALHRKAMERLDLEIALREAAGRGELVLHYQPIVAAADGRLRGVEALLRWQRPGFGLVPPMDFIPLAEDSGLIVEIGAWAVRRATSDVAAWLSAGLLPDDFSVSVNLSRVQLADKALPETVADALRASGLPPHMLCLEITESAVMDDPEAALRALGTLRGLGVELAIDDFGVGYSSLEHVARLLPVSVLKLDRSFVMAMDDERDLAIVSTVASLASSLRITAVAEGVESADQARRIADLGYPLAQGFFYSRPADAASIHGALLATARAAA